MKEARTRASMPRGTTVGLLGMLTLAACGAEPPLPAQEAVGSISTALAAPGSLVKEAEETITNANGASLGTLEAINDSRNDRRSHYVLALHSPDGTNLRVQLRSLKDDLGMGVSRVVDSESFSVSTIRRVRVIPFGADNFVVASRENNRLVLRSFAVVDGHSDDTAQLQLQSTVNTDEVVSSMELARVFQADPSFFQLAAIVQKTGGETRVITWRINSATGTFTRQNTLTRPTAEMAVRSSIAGVERPYGLLVSAEAFGTSTLLTPWRVNADGVITQKPSRIEASAASSISVARSGYAGVSVVRNPTTGSVAEIAAYEVDANDNITLRQSKTFGNSNEDPRNAIAIHSTGSRVFVVGTTGAGSWTARSWTNYGNQFQTDGRYGTSGTYDVASGTAVRADRLVFASLNATGGVQLSTFHDYNSPLIVGSYLPGTGSSGTPSDNKTTFSFDTWSGTQSESLIASSPRFVTACGTGRCYYFDKAGNPLQRASGAAASDRLVTIFSTVKDVFLRHLDVQYVCDATTNNDECPIHEAFDTKLFYSATINRFVVMAHLRNVDGPGHDKYSAHMGIAVSISEDPRDGFHVYVNSDSLVRDNLSASAGGGMLIATHGGGSDSISRPSAWLFDLRDMASGASFVKNTKIMAVQTDGSTGALLAPLQYSDEPANTSVGFIVGRGGTPVARRVFSFPRQLVGPVSVTSYTSSKPQYASGNNTEIDTIEIFEHSGTNGNILARWWDTGGTNSTGSDYSGGKSFMGVQYVTLQVSPTSGILSGTTTVRTPVACPQIGSAPPYNCTRPNITARNGRLFLSYLHVDTNNKYNFAGSYLPTVSHAPKFVSLRLGSGNASGAPGTQTANLVPDGATPWSNDFWGIQTVSQSDGSFTTKGARAFEP